MNTPPANNPAVEQTETAQPGQLSRFLREVMAELKKTNFPSRNDLTKAVMVVIITIVAVALFLFISDVIAAKLVEFLGIVPPSTGR